MHNAEKAMLSAIRKTTARTPGAAAPAAAGAPARSGFTLVEMMVVILLIVVLSGMTFRMVAVMGRNNDVSQTRSKLEKLGHALEEYRSIYGKYPEVKLYPVYEDSDGDGVSDNFVGIRQPMGYEYPMLTGFDEQGAENSAKTILSAEKNGAFEYGAADSGTRSGIFFTFGLLSYLIPRYNGAAGSDDAVKWLCGYYTKGGNEYQDSDNAFSHWRDNNDKPSGSETVGDPDRDLAAARRILMHLGGYLDEENRAVLSSSIVTVLGAADDGICRRVSGELKVVTNTLATVRDSWYRELRYRSLPPYDNYDLWSAGPDGKTVGDLCADQSHWTEKERSDGTHYRLRIGGTDVWFIGDGAKETADDIHLGRD